MTRLSAITMSILLAISSLVGCQDPRYVKQKEIRRSRVDQHLKYFGDHNAAGPERIKQTLDIHSSVAEGHKESLKQTTALFRRMHEGKVERWESQHHLRLERVGKYLHGKPDEIDDTWAKMIY